jgi:DNA-binding IclR family transcriptional regulator
MRARSRAPPASIAAPRTNILRTLQAEGFVGYDEATRSYSLSLHILELAYGVLRRSGLMDLARPLMHAISDAHGVSVYVSKVLGPLLSIAVGLGRRRVPH